MPNEYTYFCDHCGHAIRKDFYVPQRSLWWCGPCKSMFGYLLKQAGVLYCDNSQDGFWEESGLLEKLKLIPKKGTNYSASVQVPLLAEVVLAENQAFCKRSYYGIECSCPKCPPNQSQAGTRNVFGY